MKHPQNNLLIVKSCLSLVLALSAAAAILTSCSGAGSSAANEVAGDTLTAESDLLTLVDCGSYLVADIKNPWDSSRLLQRYVLVPDSAGNLDGLPEGTVVHTPLRNSLV